MAGCPRRRAQLPCFQQSQAPEQRTHTFRRALWKKKPERWRMWKTEDKLGDGLFTSCIPKSDLGKTNDMSLEEAGW